MIGKGPGEERKEHSVADGSGFIEGSRMEAGEEQSGIQKVAKMEARKQRRKESRGMGRVQRGIAAREWGWRKGTWIQ